MARVASPRVGNMTRMQRSRETSAVAKARYHDIDGAGRNKVVRRFFGLTDREMTSIQDLVTRWLDRQLGA